MIELTAGYVAGIIALGIVIAQVVCPTALAFLLAGQLNNRESAATWTVAGRNLHSSLWPTFITSDPAKNRGVRRGVVVMAYALPTLTFLIAVAGIVTPLGLYEKDVLAKETITGTFAYARDSTAFFEGTSPRDNKPFSRTCTYAGLCYTPCPYSTGSMIWESNGLQINCSSVGYTNATVPSIVRDIYSSGTANSRTTVSNFFDIEWRQMTTQYDRAVNNGSLVPSGVFRQLESFALTNEFRVVEGLVVDAKSGGIGFRNHTLPTKFRRGATWSEDLLFIEPDVVCVENNLTLDFEISTSKADAAGVKVANLVLTDRGGFTNLNTTNPYNDTRYDENTPDLRGRAYQTAWYINALSMIYMNVTSSKNETLHTEAFEYLDSKIGKTFKLPHDDFADQDYQFMQIGQDFGALFGLEKYSLDDEDSPYPNPYNVTSDDFGATLGACQGTGIGATALLNNTYVACNLIRGVPKRVNDGPSTIFDSGSRWSAPLYTCTSSVKATIKQVTFFHNGTTNNLDKLAVRNIEEKKYSRKEDMPLWGIEDWFFTLTDYNPVWGLVDDAYEGFQNVSTVRQPSFYFLGNPNYVDTLGLGGLNPGYVMENIPAAVAPLAALGSVTLTSITDDAPEYIGHNSLSLWLKWKELSASVKTAPRIISLIWTDYAASAMVGSKGVLGERNAHPEQAASIHILPTVHRVGYHYAFGVPAYLLLLCVVVCVLMVLGSALTGQSSIRLVDQRLKQTSIGRVLTTMFYPDTSTFDMKGLEWSNNNGERQLDLGVGPPMPSGDVKPPASASSGDQSGTYIEVPQMQSFPGYEYPIEHLQYIPARKALP